MITIPIENANAIINIAMDALYKIGRYGLVSSVKRLSNKKDWIVTIKTVNDKKLEIYIDSQTMSVIQILYTIGKLEVDIYTSDIEYAGGLGTAYLGIGGREFKLDRPAHKEFKEGSKDTFIIGKGSNIENDKGANDLIMTQNSYEINDKDIQEFPKYIRYEPKNDNDDWNIDRIELRVYDNSDILQLTVKALEENGNIWLGNSSGLIIGLR